MGNIGDELKKVLNRRGITRQVEAVGVVEAAQKEIAKYIPEEDFEVISFKEGVLKIYVASAVVSSQIQLNSNKIKSVLGQKISLRFTQVDNKDKE